MSRIYEALQRANRERNTASVIAGQLAADDPIDIPDFGEPQSILVDPPLRNIQTYTWKPCAAFLPTLGDRGAGVEQFRSLRTRIYEARYLAPLKTILVCSGMPAEGKSFIIANLAMSLARNDVNQILLIDGDLRRPTLHKLLGAPNSIGLSDYLAGDAHVEKIMQRKESSKREVPGVAGPLANLTFIPAGNAGDNASELVANHRIEQLISAVSAQFDWILIDSAPALAVTDAVELSHAADAVLLVARAGKTPFTVAQRAQVAFNNARILGFVLNDAKEASRTGYSYYEYYGAPAAGAGSRRRR